MSSLLELNSHQEKWKVIIMKLIEDFKLDINSLNENLDIMKANKYWLDLIGAFVGLGRSYKEINLISQSESTKLLNDSSYRINLLVRLSSVYDDFTFTIFDEVYSIFLSSNRFLVYIFDDLIQFSFYDINDEELTKIQNNKLILKSYSAGRNTMKVTYGYPDTFRLDGLFNKRMSSTEFYGNIK